MAGVNPAAGPCAFAHNTTGSRVLPWVQQQGGSMFKATLDLAAEIAHDLNLSRELVWEIIKGKRYNTREDLEILVCKALA